MNVETTTPVNKEYPQTTVTAIVEAPIDQVFQYIPPVYLPHIFPGAGLIPGIKNTSINEGWNRAGLSRTVYFADGSTSQETMLTHNGPTSFSYKNENFSSPILGALLARLEGEWLFTKLHDGRTKIEWTYRTIPTSFFSRLFIGLVLIRFFKRMLQQALDILTNDLETGNLMGTNFPPAPAVSAQ